MTYAVDSNLLIDVLHAPSVYTETSAVALEAARAAGLLVVSEVVYAEVSAFYLDPAAFPSALERLSVRFAASAPETLVRAGRLFRDYRQAGGARRQMLPDFMVDAHALEHADALLTRDRGFYREYFSDLKVIDPTE
ncbi:MAG: type II toxin-antitoxin system VapC family toxin [Opitutales bacterium]